MRLSCLKSTARFLTYLHDKTWGDHQDCVVADPGPDPYVQLPSPYDELAKESFRMAGFIRLVRRFRYTFEHWQAAQDPLD